MSQKVATISLICCLTWTTEEPAWLMKRFTLVWLLNFKWDWHGTVSKNTTIRSIMTPQPAPCGHTPHISTRPQIVYVLCILPICHSMSTLSQGEEMGGEREEIKRKALTAGSSPPSLHLYICQLAGMLESSPVFEWFPHRQVWAYGSGVWLIYRCPDPSVCEYVFRGFNTTLPFGGCGSAGDESWPSVVANIN